MTARESINTGKWSIESLNELVMKAASICFTGERIAFLSESLRDTPYADNTLIGGADFNEIFVIDFSGVDCFTFLDYIEAMRVSKSFAVFMECLKKIRYRGGSVSFANRNHFFSDWLEFNPGFVEDATEKVGLNHTKTTSKVLNRRESSSFFVPGIGVVERNVRYIPSFSLNDQLISRIDTGDYIGIYADHPGLDVTHVGIFIRCGEGSLFRHASSAREVRKVVDQDFVDYVRKSPGIIVLRPKDVQCD